MPFVKLPDIVRQYGVTGLYTSTLFNFDKGIFSRTGLILVDLSRTEPKILERYMGRDETLKFLGRMTGS